MRSWWEVDPFRHGCGAHPWRPETARRGRAPPGAAGRVRGASGASAVLMRAAADGGAPSRAYLLATVSTLYLFVPRLVRHRGDPP